MKISFFLDYEEIFAIEDINIEDINYKTTGRTQVLKKDETMLTGMNYTKLLIVYLIIKGRKLIQISMELWKVDCNLEILKGFF